MFTLTFHLFAYPREKLNTQKITHSFSSEITIQAMIDFLTNEYTAIPFGRYRYAIDKKYITDMAQVLSKDTEIYVIPPISGG